MENTFKWFLNTISQLMNKEWFQKKINYRVGITVKKKKLFSKSFTVTNFISQKILLTNKL